MVQWECMSIMDDGVACWPIVVLLFCVRLLQGEDVPMDGTTNLLATRVLKEHGRHFFLKNLLDLEPKSAKIPLIIGRFVTLWRVNHGGSRNLKELVIGIGQPRAMMCKEDKGATSAGLQGLLAGFEH